MAGSLNPAYENFTTLSRLPKARRDLAGQGLEPAERLRQALVKLEEEWGELMKLREQPKN